MQSNPRVYLAALAAVVSLLLLGTYSDDSEAYEPSYEPPATSAGFELG